MKNQVNVVGNAETKSKTMVNGIATAKIARITAVRFRITIAVTALSRWREKC